MPLRSSFFFNDTATTEIYTLSLHDALPILLEDRAGDAKRLLHPGPALDDREEALVRDRDQRVDDRSEEHTSELQSQSNLVCRLLLENKNHALDHRRHRPRPARRDGRHHTPH